jgi:hypothetical protein
MSKLNSLRALVVAAAAATTVMLPASAGAATVDATAGKAAGPQQSMPAPTHGKARSLARTTHLVGFRNSFGKAVFVVTMKYDPVTCAGMGNWQTRGWFKLMPGEEKTLMDTDNDMAAFYARAADGTQWTGPYGPAGVNNSGPFLSCSGVVSGSYQSVGFRLIDMRGTSGYHLINLLPTVA